LEEKEEEYELPKMSGEEARYLTQKMKKEAEMEEEDEMVEKMPGLGFNKYKAFFEIFLGIRK
jgi:hypothetical protein